MPGAPTGAPLANVASDGTGSINCSSVIAAMTILASVAVNPRPLRYFPLDTLGSFFFFFFFLLLFLFLDFFLLVSAGVLAGGWFRTGVALRAAAPVDDDDLSRAPWIHLCLLT